MEMFTLKGKYIFEAKNIKTGKKQKIIVDNVVCQFFYTSVFKFLNQNIDSPASSLLNLTHLSIGTGITAATRSDTSMETEVFRKTYSIKNYTNSAFTLKTSLAASEGNPTGGFIKEVGVIAGGTETSGTGSIVSHANVNIMKNDNIKLLITWILTGV